jgi:hypothetical protein
MLSESSDKNIFTNNHHNNFYSKIDNKTIKEWLFYDSNNQLCSIEKHTFGNVCNESHTQFYFNHNRVYDINEIECYTDIIINTKYLIEEHYDFTNQIVNAIGPLTFENRLTYGWYNKNIPFSLSIYKYKKIECIVQFNNEKTILNKEQTLEFVTKYLVDVVSASKHYNNVVTHNVTKNTNIDTHESELINVMNKLNVSDTSVQETFELINTMNKLNVSDYNNDTINNTDTHLFITYPKNKRIEFQSCKPYDPEEIYFNQQLIHGEDANVDIEVDQVEIAGNRNYYQEPVQRDKDDDTIMMF